MECVKIGSGDKVCWITHRQHPGETMAEYYAEGLLSHLLGLNSGYAVDGMVSNVLKQYTFYIVPSMCPDGAFRGHLRTNAHGQNLNREWCPSGSKEDGTCYDASTLECSPEVYHILKKINKTSVDAFLDVHNGDEALPFNFIDGGEGCANWSPRLKALQGAFLAKYARNNSDMQVPVHHILERKVNFVMKLFMRKINM
jgi:murein tripeptide amidase MpaA